MDLYLTYRGQIPAKSSDKTAIWDMRRCFHSQLARLWGREPFSVLKEWEDSNFSAGAPNFIKHVGAHTFVPFFGKKVGIVVRLDIKLLTATPPLSSVVRNGDLDNRLKRVVDALRAPMQKGELIDGLGPNTRWYTLIDDDDAVTEFSASLAPYLDSGHDKESFVFVRVKTAATNVSLDNLSML